MAIGNLFQLIFETCFKAQLGQNLHTPFAFGAKLAILHFGSFKQNKITTSLARLKQVIYITFSADCNPRSSCKHTENSLLSKILSLHLRIFLPKLQTTRAIPHCFFIQAPLWACLHPHSTTGKPPARLFSSRYHPWQLKIRAKPSYLELSSFIHTTFEDFVYICLKHLQQKGHWSSHYSPTW